MNFVFTCSGAVRSTGASMSPHLRGRSIVIINKLVMNFGSGGVKWVRPCPSVSSTFEGGGIAIINKLVMDFGSGGVKWVHL